MCKKVNIFLPILVAFFFLMSLGIARWSYSARVDFPLWTDFVMSESLLLIPAVLYVLIMKINVVKSLPYRLLKPTDAILAIIMGYALVPMVLLIGNISALFSTNYLQSMETGLTEYPFLIQLLLVAVLPAVVEEFVFRGVFYHSYRKNGILGAALMSGLVFGMIHMNINQFCYAFVLGIIFALLVEGTGSMVTSMIAHFAINSTSIIVMKLESRYIENGQLAGNQASLSQYSVPQIIFTLTLLAIVAALFAGIAFLLFWVLSKRSGRWEYLVYNLKKGVRAQNGEHFVTLPALITLILIFVYMVAKEIL